MPSNGLHPAEGAIVPGPRSSAVSREVGAHPDGPIWVAHRLKRFGAAAAPFLLAWALIGPGVQPALAAGVTMDARALLAGHTRVGSWLALEINVANDGPRSEEHTSEL